VVPAVRGGAEVTPEARAAKAMHEAGESGLTILQADVPKWHSVIALAIRDALIEARGVCTFIPDRDHITDLFLGTEPPAEPLVPDYEAPPSPPAGLLTCFVCNGVGALGSVSCLACNGRGVIADSGPAPDPNPGLVAFKSCGCAKDWIGSGAPDEYRVERVAHWTAQGFRFEAMDFKDANPLITAGASCDHDRRATPRLVTGPAEGFDDLPRGSQ
jgi:hypothetical protein